MKRQPVFFFFLLLFSTPIFSNGQAIRVNYVGYSGYQKSVSTSNYFYGFGYEHNIGSKIALQFEYNKGYSLDENYGYYYYDNINSPVNFEYNLEIPWYEFAYQSKYFFSGNDEKSFYISSGISMRMAKYNMEIYSVSYNPQNVTAPPPIPTGLIIKSYNLFPISLKVGWRNTIDGWFGDYNFGISFIPGANNRKSGNPNIDQYLKDEGLKNISFNIGLTFGFGWVD